MYFFNKYTYKYIKHIYLLTRSSVDLAILFCNFSGRETHETYLSIQFLSKLLNNTF